MDQSNEMLLIFMTLVVFLQCSRTCETGHQMRMVVCTSMGVVVPDDQCDGNLRPISERFCNGHIDCFRKFANFEWTFEILSTIVTGFAKRGLICTSINI